MAYVLFLSFYLFFQAGGNRPFIHPKLGLLSNGFNLKTITLELMTFKSGASQIDLLCHEPYILFFAGYGKSYLCSSKTGID
jgi:hypothetical protein